MAAAEVASYEKLLALWEECARPSACLDKNKALRFPSLLPKFVAGRASGHGSENLVDNYPRTFLKVKLRILPFKKFSKRF